MNSSSTSFPHPVVYYFERASVWVLTQVLYVKERTLAFLTKESLYMECRYSEKHNLMLDGKWVSSDDMFMTRFVSFMTRSSSVTQTRSHSSETFQAGGFFFPLAEFNYYCCFLCDLYLACFSFNAEWQESEDKALCGSLSLYLSLSLPLSLLPSCGFQCFFSLYSGFVFLSDTHLSVKERARLQTRSRGRLQRACPELRSHSLHAIGGQVSETGCW